METQYNMYPEVVIVSVIFSAT